MGRRNCVRDVPWICAGDVDHVGAIGKKKRCEDFYGEKEQVEGGGSGGELGDGGKQKIKDAYEASLKQELEDDATHTKLEADAGDTAMPYTLDDAYRAVDDAETEEKNPTERQNAEEKQTEENDQQQRKEEEKTAQKHPRNKPRSSTATSAPSRCARAGAPATSGKCTRTRSSGQRKPPPGWRSSGTTSVEWYIT